MEREMYLSKWSCSPTSIFSVFAELHKMEEMGPVLAKIPACAEAERPVHMMSKHIAGFLFHFLVDASLSIQFVMDLIKATCDPTLVKEIDECEWNPKMKTVTTPDKRRDNDKLGGPMHLT